MSEAYHEPLQAVEARFVCDWKKPLDQVSVQFQLSASIQGRDNTEWAPFTPSGTISMVVNGPAGAVFAAGKRYRVLIEEVGPDE
ncbi:MAG TPA: hypothetical protein VGS97_19940 [Actinocrinis sp.]|uniref:hypothetical protein n=1 Tax=Actinocrinis sp. TaxID=1920516 RepID=UPI002DDCE1A0|nr:hypothetical protein [Actinocrinis sp.]HEV2346380.1 hypothetical protein [Actinocrinis sp.]